MGPLGEALLKRVCGWPDEFAPMDVVWAGYIELSWGLRPMPTAEDLDALAADWKTYRANKIQESEAT